MEAIDASAVANVLGISVEHVNLGKDGVMFLPQRIYVIAQGSDSVTYDSKKFRATSHTQVGDRFGYGSPAHLIARQLLPSNGDGVGTIPVTFFPLQPDGSGVVASGDITASGTADKSASYRVKINNIASDPFVITPDDDEAAIHEKITTALAAVPAMPMLATDNGTDVGLESKWSGESANGLHIEVEGPDEGVTFAITQPEGGLANPDVQPALDAIGNVWETLVLNAMNFDDTTVLDAIQTFGDGRWEQTSPKPFVSFVGCTEAAVSDAIDTTDSRKDDKVNAQLVSPGSNDLPFVVAARQLARIAPIANNNPPKGYAAQRATGLTPGDDEDQWSFTQRDQAVKGGSSTVEIVDDIVQLKDIVTMYHPSGETPPPYRYVVDIVKIMNVIFNVDLIFAAEEWASAPLIPNDQATINPDARKPKNAVTQVHAMHDSLALNAIISDPKFAKKNTTSGINSQNSKRLDLRTRFKVSGNSEQKSVDLQWGFYFGAETAA